MLARTRMFATLLLLTVASGVANADDIKGSIENIDLDRQSFVLQGITFQVSDDTEFGNGLEGFVDLVAGIVVEVAFEYRDDKHYVIEIGRDD